MIHILFLVPLYKNEHNLSRYIRFIQNRKTIYEKYKTHRHHILPKAYDFFPEFKNLKLHNWNYVNLTPREHYIAHRLLHRAFPKSSQTRAFYNMSNEQKYRSSKDYENSRLLHIEKLKKLTKNPERNKKISESLRGKPKSESHINNLKGRKLSAESIEKIRVGNIGKTISKESRRKMSNSRKGKRKIPLSGASKENIASSKMSFKIITPMGEFNSFTQFESITGIKSSILKNIYRNLNKIPKIKNLDLLSINRQPNLTWYDLGFSKGQLCQIVIVGCNDQ